MTDRTKMHLEFLLDMSGSTGAYRYEAEQGFNSLISSLRKRGLSATVTLNGFANSYRNFYLQRPLDEVPPLLVGTQGGSSLYDAVARTITDLGVRLASRPEKDRPAVVVVVIVSDGSDNSSIELTAEQVNTLVSRQETVYRWRFVFLGASRESVTASQAIGVPQQRCLYFKPQYARRAYLATADLIEVLRQTDALDPRVGFSERHRMETVNELWS